MKYAKASLRILLFSFLVLFSFKMNAQILGLTMGTPATNNVPGVNFPVTVNFNLLPSTTTATATIAYQNQIVSYVANGTLPPCINVINNGSQLTITISNLNTCPNTGSVAFPLNFRFNCPDTCAGIPKTALFQGAATDVNGNPLTASCTATGLLPINITLGHTFSTYYSAAAELTFRINYNNLNCFRLKNPAFNIALSQGTIVGVYGTNYAYQVTGNVITRVDATINAQQSDNIYYRVRIPCNTPANQVISSHVTLTGENCGIPNSLITNHAGPDPSYTTSATPPASLPSISLFQQHTATQFNYRITNNGNTPLNLVATSRLPAIHVTQVQQNTDQPNNGNTVEYDDCNSVTTGPFIFPGNSAVNSTVPTNTRRIVHRINNLEPGQAVWLFTTYNTSSSCSGTGGAPFQDTLNIQYNCVAPPVPCMPCGPAGVMDAIIVHNPTPVISCQQAFSMGNNCGFIGDTILLTHRFRNTGDGALNGGVYTVPLPAAFSPVPGSETYAGFTTNPTVNNPNLISFNLPTIPPNTAGYEISFRVVINPGALGNAYSFFSNVVAPGYSATSCNSVLNVCLYGAIDIKKRVRGNQNSQFGNTGQGEPGTLVDYELTLYNSGTSPVDNLVVVDRIPASGNRSIGTGALLSNAFTMQMQTAPASPNYTINYTNTQNICTNWPSTATNCTNGTWGTGLAQRGVRFTYTPSFAIAPGDSTKIYFQTMIPGNAGNNEEDCNTAAFIANSNGTPLLFIESNTACITNVNPCGPTPSPTFTPVYTCVNNNYTVTANSTAASPAQHEWSLMQMISCSGGTTDANTVGQMGITQTTQNASFVVPTSSTCYYIKHRIFVPGCYDVTTRVQLNIPSATNNFVTQDINGHVKTTFCLGEDVIFNGTASTGESHYTVEIKRRLIGATAFLNWGSFSFTGQATTHNISQLLQGQGLYLDAQHEYSIVFTISNPANCISPIANKAIFKVECCADFFNAGFQIDVSSTPASYTMTSSSFNPYTSVNAQHEWYVLSSPNPVGGPYTPEYSTTATTLVWPGAQYNLYYTVIHKLITSCGEVCVSRTQYQTNNRSTSEEVDGCCLAAYYWANGAGNPPAPMSADFDISTSTSGNAYYTISVTPTNTYDNLNGVTHEWYLWSSPNPTGGPYTPVSQGNYPNFAFNGASDGLYYFIVHKVITPCGEVCFTQDVCRNCGEKKACDIKWPACHPPQNLRMDCRRERLSWDPVLAAGGYVVQLYYNDPECCRSEYTQIVKEFNVSGTVFNVANYNHPKFNCFSWRVRAKCDGGYSEWSSSLCYFCPDPIGPIILGKNEGDKAVKLQPEITPQVFPNPNDGSMFLRIKATGELTVSVEVFNATGVPVKSIAESKHPDGNFTKSLNLNGVAKGLYLVVFKTNFGTYSEKVVVQ